jgi:hypothetical protein
LRQLTNDVTAMRDEMRVQTAMMLCPDAAMARRDATLNAVLERVRLLQEQTVDSLR